MSEQRHAEFREAELTAMRYLTAPDTVPKAQSLDRWQFCLRLWQYPSFSENRSWGIFRSHERGSRQVRTLVRQITWDRLCDAERFALPLVGLERGFHTQPTIEVRDRPLDSAAFDSRMTALRAISFPAFSTHGLGIDGEVFGVAVPHHHGATVEWWCDGPESWRALTCWAAEVRDWLTTVAFAPPQAALWAQPCPRLP